MSFYLMAPTSKAQTIIYIYIHICPVHFVEQPEAYIGMMKQSESQIMSVNPLFRNESFGFGYYNVNPPGIGSMMEKRQLFLRSYQFCRKKSVTERIKGSLVRVKKLVWLRLRSARTLRKLVFSRFKCGFYFRRRRFFRLFSNNNTTFHHYPKTQSSCFFQLYFYSVHLSFRFHIFHFLFLSSIPYYSSLFCEICSSVNESILIIITHLSQNVTLSVLCFFFFYLSFQS